MAEAITRAMRVQDILAILPSAEPLLAEYGLHCVGCSGASFETLEEGYLSHGFKEDQLDSLVTDLNILLEKEPPRPATLEVTEAAARSLATLLESEGQSDHYLVVSLDDVGSFCLEVLPDVAADHHLFGHSAVPSLKLAAAPLTLKRIGGAVIDHREGRFKLDLPEDSASPTGYAGTSAHACACKSGGSCGCDGEKTCGC